MQNIGDEANAYLEPPRFTCGIWVDLFEGSSFHEGLTDPTQLRGREHTTWLEFNAQAMLPADFRRIGEERVYRIAFIGRTSGKIRRPLDGYGHFNLSPSLVLVDEVHECEDLGCALDL